MKYMLVMLVLVMAIPVEPTVAPIVLNDPSMSTASACDEFHGDANCTCDQSVYAPCCPWWEPWKCPAPIKAKIREGAQRASSYYSEAEGFFMAAAIPLCAAMEAIGPLPCVTVGGGAFYANRMKMIYDKIAEAASRYMLGTPPYWLPYDLRIPDAAELGMEYTGNPNIDAMIYATTVAWGYSDFIVESSDRVRYCYHDPAANCAGWQQERVDEGLRQLGNWIYNSAVDLDEMGYELDQTGADLQEIPVVQVLYDEATWADYMANTVQP